MQKLQDVIVRSNCVLFTEVDMEFQNDEEFIKFVEKWTERYQLKLSPKERFKQKKKGQPTFDLIIKPNLSYDDSFTKDLLDIAQNDPDDFTRSDFDFLNNSQSYLPIKFFFSATLIALKFLMVLYPFTKSMTHLKSTLMVLKNSLMSLIHQFNLATMSLFD